MLAGAAAQLKQTSPWFPVRETEMLLLSELVQLAASLAVRLLGLRCDPRVTAPSPAVLVCCSCGALEDPSEGEVSALTPSLPI